MILAEVRDYLAARGRAPLTDLAARFDVDAEAVRAMLDHLVRKGRLRRLDAVGSACGGCCGCADQLPEVYERVERR
jgi:DNA-binding IclR family transcriptional regulator